MAKRGKTVSQRDGEHYEAYTFCLIELQSDLRSFIHSLVPYYQQREDILQDVNRLLLEKRHQFTEGTNFKAWAFRFTRNVTMNHIQRLKRQNRFVFDSELLEKIAVENENDPEENKDQLKALQGCLQKIDSSNRELLMACYKRHGEIEGTAQRNGLDANTLRSKLFRLRIALRRCIEQGTLKT